MSGMKCPYPTLPYLNSILPLIFRGRTEPQTYFTFTFHGIYSIQDRIVKSVVLHFFLHLIFLEFFYLK